MAALVILDLMSLPSLNIFTIIAAASPLIVVLYLMIGRNWRGSKAGPAGWLTAIVVSVIIFGAGPRLLLVSLGRSLLLAFFVLYIIWMALLLYHVVNDAGAIGVIGRELPGLAHDRPSQALLLGWTFGSFLQGASGFGVPAAVVAPLLVGLGFPANSAVVISLVGHAWAVTFGSLGSSFYSLIAATGEAGEILAGPSALLLGLCCLLCGLVVLWETGRMSAIQSQWGELIAVGLIMAGVQYGLAMAGLWSLAAFGAGLVGLILMIVDLRTGLFNAGAWRTRLVRRSPVTSGSDSALAAEPPSEAASSTEHRLNIPALTKAAVPYLILIVIVVVGELFLEKPLSIIIFDPQFPEVITRFGWITPAGPGRAISLLGHAGALLMYTSILSFLWFRWQGTFGRDESYSGRIILGKTIRGSTKSTIGIVTLVAMAVTMQHAGMTQLLAQVLSSGTSFLFPLLSPFIGALGAFMTGSNTNSNVVFGQLQLETALTIGLALTWILAAQTAGGAIGSLFAPAKVIVGCSTVEGASDSQVLKKAVVYGLAIVAILGLVVFLVSLTA